MIQKHLPPVASQVQSQKQCENTNQEGRVSTRMTSYSAKKLDTRDRISWHVPWKGIQLDNLPAHENVPIRCLHRVHKITLLPPICPLDGHIKRFEQLEKLQKFNGWREPDTGSSCLTMESRSSPFSETIHSKHHANGVSSLDKRDDGSTHCTHHSFSISSAKRPLQCCHCPQTGSYKRGCCHHSMAWLQTPWIELDTIIPNEISHWKWRISTIIPGQTTVPGARAPQPALNPGVYIKMADKWEETRWSSKEELRNMRKVKKRRKKFRQMLANKREKRKPDWHLMWNDLYSIPLHCLFVLCRYPPCPRHQCSEKYRIKPSELLN